MAIKHAKISGKAAPADTTLVGGPNWDASHTIDAGTITTAELGGDITAAGKALLDDANAAAQRTTLGLVVIAASGSASDLGAGTVPAARMPAHTGDVTSSAGAVALSIAAAAVTFAKMAALASARFVGRITGGSGDPEALTGTQATTLLDAFTAVLKGLVPAPGSSVGKFLKDDATWAFPASSGWFGDASDGNATDPGTPSRPMFYDTLTLSASFALDSGGWPIFARTISVPSGTATIKHNGGNGGNATNDSGTGGVAGTTAAAGFYVAGAIGVAGGPNTGAAAGSCPRGFVAGSAAAITGPTAGNNGNPGNNGAAGQGGSGGAGGAAVAGSGGTSGAGGTVTLMAQANGDIRMLQSAIEGRPARSTTDWTGGSGGGGGGNANVSGGGGGSGAGGAQCTVVAGVITGTLIVEARGGNGGNGATGTTLNNGGGGGGGGAAGGIALCVYGSGTAPTVQAPGGTGGNGGTGVGTSKNGGNGGTGGAGVALTFQVG